ncbi:helix-turn-helix transcriptional regulator [Idiomarina sp.]|uniref:helix-turn-helix domain-containing protein n=1 Tax=Idiomarina sp. TaxID=1874361 RepID=UPI00262FD326|nr:helix-turn-helix transcriptional regulator [Idiomarina sp.]
MLTPFGKAVRKLRIDLGVTLKSLAESLDKTSSYISAIETGKRSVTGDILEQIINALNPSSVVEQELREAAELSQTSVEVKLKGKNQTAREAALLFARNFDELNEDDYEKLKKLLNK